MHKWTEEQHQFVLKNVKGISNLELAKMINIQFGLNLSVNQVKAFKANQKISSGLDGRFKKGSIPVNKGLTWDEYLTKEQQELSRKTTFKKGNVPASYLPVGTEIERLDGYVYVKIADPKKWKQKHRVIYEKANGPVPANHKLIFADGNKRNFALSNLVLVSDHDLLTMNREKLFYNNNPELTKLGVLISKLINKTYEMENKNNENKKSDH